MHLFARRPRGVAPPFANAPPLRAAPDIDSDGAPQILGFVCRPGPGLASCCPGWPGGPGVGTLETPGCAGCARRVYSGVSSSTNGPTTEAPRRAAECARSFVMPRGRAPEGAALSGNHEHVSVAHPQTADVLLAVPFALIGLALVRSGVRSPGSSSSGERHSGPTSRRSDEHGRGLHRSNRRVLPAAGRPCGGVLLAPGRYALVLRAGETRDRSQLVRALGVAIGDHRRVDGVRLLTERDPFAASAAHLVFCGTSGRLYGNYEATEDQTRHRKARLGDGIG
jgi:hypothetical protein